MRSLLQELIRIDKEKEKPNLYSPNNFYNHSIGVSGVSLLTGCSLSYNRFKVDIGLVEVSGLLHDVGNIIATQNERIKDPELAFNSIYGANYMEGLGYSKIAETIRPGFTTKELLELKPGMFPKLNSDDFIPKTLEKKVVVYANTRVAGDGCYVSFDDRMADIRNRYNKESLMIKSLDSGGEERLRDLSREIEEKVGLYGI